MSLMARAVRTRGIIARLRRRPSWLAHRRADRIEAGLRRQHGWQK